MPSVSNCSPREASSSGRVIPALIGDPRPQRKCAGRPQPSGDTYVYGTGSSVLPVSRGHRWPPRCAREGTGSRSQLNRSGSAAAAGPRRRPSGPTPALGVGRAGQAMAVGAARGADADHRAVTAARAPCGCHSHQQIERRDQDQGTAARVGWSSAVTAGSPEGPAHWASTPWTAGTMTAAALGHRHCISALVSESFLAGGNPSAGNVLGPVLGTAWGRRLGGFPRTHREVSTTSIASPTAEPARQARSRIGRTHADGGRQARRHPTDAACAHRQRTSLVHTSWPRVEPQAR